MTSYVACPAHAQKKVLNNCLVISISIKSFSKWIREEQGDDQLLDFHLEVTQSHSGEADEIRLEDQSPGECSALSGHLLRWRGFYRRTEGKAPYV